MIKMTFWSKFPEPVHDLQLLMENWYWRQLTDLSYGQWQIFSVSLLVSNTDTEYYSNFILMIPQNCEYTRILTLKNILTNHIDITIMPYVSPPYKIKIWLKTWKTSELLQHGNVMNQAFSSSTQLCVLCAIRFYRVFKIKLHWRETTDCCMWKKIIPKLKQN